MSQAGTAVSRTAKAFSRTGKLLSSAGKGVLGWVARYVGWLALTAFITLGGAALLMFFKDWTLKSLFTSMLAWPALGLGMLVAAPLALLPLGRLYFGSALAAGLAYNLLLLLS